MERVIKKMQVYGLLKERIGSGYYPPGSRLPREIELAAELEVARITLRSALELLEMEKLISRVKGQGTFVRNEKDAQPRILTIIDRDDPHRTDRASNPFLYILPCIRLAAERMNVVLETCDPRSLQTALPEQCAARIRSRGVQGIFWMGNNFTGREPLLETVRRTGLPVLLPHAIFSDAEVTGFTVMGTDYRGLTRDGLKYFAAQGHRRVAYIGGSGMHGIAPSDYFSDVRAVRLDPAPELLKLINWRDGKETVFDAVSSLMDLPEPPTAVISYSDYLSLQIYEYLHGKGFRIPEDVCVLTIGGQIGCDFLDPPLSALEYMDSEIGETAVKTMLEMIRGRSRPKFIVTPHRLHVRESTERVLLRHSTKTKKEKRK